MIRVLRVIVSASIGLLLTAAVSGCGSGSAPPLALTAKDSGSRQRLAVGQKLTISLPWDVMENNRWAVDGQVPPQLEQSGAPQYSGKANVPGAGGAEVWTFVGKSTGTSTLKLKYWRSFEPTVAPVQTFEVAVEVR